MAKVSPMIAMLVATVCVFLAQAADSDECPKPKCVNECPMKKLPDEKCPWCYCGEEKRDQLLQEACKGNHGECKTLAECPRGAQDRLLCKAQETCCYFE